MQKIRPHRNCPCCGCGAVEIIAVSRSASITGFPVTLDYDVVFCEECGFCYADTKAVPADYEAYYALFSKYAPIVVKQPVFSARQNLIFAKLASKISKYCLSNKSIIADFGCGSGGLLFELRAQGFENLVGYDASPDCVEFLKSQEIEAYCYRLGDALPSDDVFDVIVLSAVLEHLMEPVQVLSVLKNHLKEDGLIFIEVPNAASFYRYVDTLCCEFNIEHINYYSGKTLSNVMKISGFEVLDNQNLFSFSSRRAGILSVVGKKSSPDNMILMRDDELFRFLKRYAAYSDVFCDGLIVKIQDIISDNKEVCFWGSGALLSTILGAGKIDLSKIKCVIDSNPFYRNLSISSIPIVAPSVFWGTPCWEKLPIIISSIRSEEAIRKTINEADKDRKIYSLIL